MNVKFNDFTASLSLRLSELLGASGFTKRTNEIFVRAKKTHEINVISVQKHSSDPKVCINLGIHYDFLPKIGGTELAKNGDIDLPDCEIRVRLSPDPTLKDYWWPISSESIDDIFDLIAGRSEEIFRRYNIDGPISEIAPEDLGENMPDFISSLTKVRASLMLARIHETRGDLKKAESFAKHGIKVAGMAVGPKKMLKEVLKRIAQHN